MEIKQGTQTKAPVLVIDDDAAQLKTLTDILETEDLQAICCRTGKEALQMCKQQEVNVIILDLRLPDIDGLVLMKQLIKQNPEVKVIVNTGYASLDSAMAAINEEAFAYVKKMGDVEELLAHIHRAFHAHLTLHSEKLEHEVKNRTTELLRANKELKKEITERKRVEAALRESEDTLKSIFRGAPTGIGMVSNRVFNYVNDRFCEMVGYSCQELIGKSARMIYPCQEEFERVGAEKYMLIRKLGRGEVETKFKRKDGVIIDVLLSSAAIDPDDLSAGVTFTVLDISERKRLQNELARAQRMETAGRVAGQIAHDFNNLLSPLSAYPALIREELPEYHSVLKMVDEIEFAANKIAEINQQLLALGRRGHYHMEPMDLNQLAQKVVLSQNLPNDLVVRQEFTSDLFLIKCGSAQLTRALINLITNAKEAMQGSGILTFYSENVYLDKPLKGYKTIKPGEYVKLAISDTGDGIEFEILDKIFDPFFTTKIMDTARGSGLGLSVVHGVVEDHKGYITVESVSGQGTTFSLYFPIVREDEIAATVEKAKRGTERILVVDDDPVQRRVADHLLRRLGYKIHTAASGEKAIRFTKNHPQDLLVLDMVMDGIDGTETYKQILDFQPEQRAIILSGYAMSQRVEEALRMGAGAFVTKPITLNAFARAVRKELDRKRKSQFTQIK